MLFEERVWCDGGGGVLTHKFHKKKNEEIWLDCTMSTMTHTHFVF